MVIQRIQSLWLLVAAILLGSFSFLPYADFSTGFGNFTISALSISKTGIPTDAAASLPDNVYSWVYFALDLLISIFTIITIFLYGNIKRQRKYASMALLLTVCYTASMAIYTYVAFKYWQMATFSLNGAILLPICAIIFQILALRGISRDIRTLSSYDRIR